jgi:outer membrane protein TolC
VLDACRTGLMIGVVVLCGCARYHPRPLDAPRLERDHRSRSLAAEGVRAYVESNVTPKPSEWPPASLDLPLVTALAFYYNTELDVARARVEIAEAAVVTAGGRVNLSLNTGGGYSNNPESALVFHFDVTFTIETAGKRALRTLQAQKLAEAARTELAETAWRVRSHVRGALLAHLFAARRLGLLQGEVAVRAESLELLKKRLEVGEVSRPDVTAAEIETSTATVALRTAEGQVVETRAALAAAVGVPLDSLGALPVRWQGADALPALDGLPLEKVQEAGLVHRADVRRSLLAYAAAEAALRLEVARQYPDIDLNPGYSYDEAHHKIAFGPAFAVPVFNRNKGPIAEAEARRQEGAALFTALQAQAIAEMEASLARYRTGLAEFDEADRRLAQLQRAREESVRRALAAGEADRLALARARVESAVAARVRLDVLERAQAAFGALEDAVQRPLTAGSALPAITLKSPRGNTAKGDTP